MSRLLPLPWSSWWQRPLLQNCFCSASFIFTTLQCTLWTNPVQAVWHLPGVTSSPPGRRHGCLLVMPIAGFRESGKSGNPVKNLGTFPVMEIRGKKGVSASIREKILNRGKQVVFSLNQGKISVWCLKILYLHDFGCAQTYLKSVDFLVFRIGCIRRGQKWRKWKTWKVKDVIFKKFSFLLAIVSPCMNSR